MATRLAESAARGGDGVVRRSKPAARLAVIAAGIAAVGAVVLAACGTADRGTAAVRILTHRDFHLPAVAMEAFTESTGIEVVVFREDTPGDVIDLMERSRAHPVADVVIGVDTLDLQHVIDSGLVEPYVPLAPGPLVEGLATDDHSMTPVSYIDACLIYLPSFYVVPQRRIDELPEAATMPPPLPQGIDDLVDPAHSGTVVVADPASSRMGMYFLVTLERLHPSRIAEGTPWPQVLDEMLRWGVELAPTWEHAVFERFAGGGPPPQRPISEGDPDPVTLESLAGRMPMTWGTAGMPSVYAQYQPGLPESLDVGVAPNDCVRIAFYAGVVAGAQNQSLGGRFIDAVGQPLFQFGIADRFGSRPARNDIVASPEWNSFGADVVPYRPDPAYVGANWKQWQLTWSQVVRNFATGPPPPEPEVTVTLPSS
ncbi:extracellular solute-binding protein [Candidatus Poriferisodalis sp.]|uniref:extracellular solute-binding protein n=1 Tax=Candidatus Poriferisodalis sp. TaxID=3101277 RepID=UPI003D116BC0